MWDFSRIGVIFDCDGTLIDSMAAWRALEEDLARRAGCEFTREDADALTVRTIPESGVYVHEKFGLGSSGADVERMIDEFMLDFYSTRAQLRPGARDFVCELGERGARMSVASSTPEPLLQAAFSHVGLASRFVDIISVDRVGRPKREPVVYDYARAVMGTELSLTWGFEDALYAVQTLKRAGYGVVGIYDDDLSGTFDDLQAHADFAIRSFTELSVDDFLRRVTSR